MWIRKIYRLGDSWAVTVPMPVTKTHAWAQASHVEIFYNPPNLVIKPLQMSELMRRPRQEGETLEDDEITHPKP